MDGWGTQIGTGGSSGEREGGGGWKKNMWKIDLKDPFGSNIYRYQDNLIDIAKTWEDRNISCQQVKLPIQDDVTPNWIVALSSLMVSWEPLSNPGCYKDYRLFSTKWWQDPIDEDNTYTTLNLEKSSWCLHSALTLHARYRKIFCMLPNKKYKH